MHVIGLILFYVFPLLVSVLAWCRRRDIGTMTRALRIVPIVTLPIYYPVVMMPSWMGSLFFCGLVRTSALQAVAVAAVCLVIGGMIVFGRGRREEPSEVRPRHPVVRIAYGCFSVVVTLVLMVLFASVGVGSYMAYELRPVDRSYATQKRMAFSLRAGEFARWIPPGVTDIRYHSERKFGEMSERMTGRCEESDLIRFAVEHSYPLATNSFTRLDYYIPEQDSRHVYEQMEKDAETQQRLVLGDRPLPKRFLSLTQSHTFDGGACGGAWRLILVLDRDTNELSGYYWMNCL